MRVFTLAFLPDQSAHVSVLAKNVTLEHGEERPGKNSAQVLPTPKGQGGHMRFIARLHPRGTSDSSSSNAGATTTRATDPSSVSAATATATTSTSTSISTASAAAAASTDFTDAAAQSSTDKLAKVAGRSGPTYLPPSSARRMSSTKNSTVAPGTPTPSEDDTVTHLFRYRTFSFFAMQRWMKLFKDGGITNSEENPTWMRCWETVQTEVLSLPPTILRQPHRRQTIDVNNRLFSREQLNQIDP